MNWPREYLKAIESGDEVVSIKVREVYKREVAWMDDPDFPFVFDEAAGQRPIDFIEKFCRHYEGEWAGQKIKLDLFQKAKIQLVFGWLEKDTGFRRIREVIDIRGRKNGKSTETAAVELYCLIADGEGGAQVWCTANKKDQAKIIFNAAVAMMQQSKMLLGILRKRQSDIYFPATFSILGAQAADSKTMDGLNAHFFSQDEWHEARTRKIYDVMKQSQTTRRQPLAWLISTNGFQREGFFDDRYDYATQVALWCDGYEDYRTLPLIYELDSRDEWQDPKCWKKANPGLGTIKSYQALEQWVEDAKRDPTALPTVLTKDFNIPENTNQAWLPYEACVNETVVPIELLEKSYAIGGCDLSATTDLTCATLLIKKPNDDNFYVLQKYFLPETRVKNVEGNSAREAPYQLWSGQGHLHICDGATVDYKAVTQWFVDMVKQHDIRPLWIAYDRALAGYWVEEMQDVGFDMERIAQGPFTWSYPMKRLGGLLEDGRVIYQNNPMLRWCLLNTGVKTTNRDGIQSIQPVKTSATKRIDGMVSLLNAFTGYCNHEDDFITYVKQRGVS
jgi:phage terminase large subunit-like protein